LDWEPLCFLTATDDLKDFFNQLKLAPQEYWKQNLLWCDLLAHASNEGMPDVVEADLQGRRSVPHDAGPSLMHTQLWPVFVRHMAR
jgi:hypothetical protein